MNKYAQIQNWKWMASMFYIKWSPVVRKLKIVKARRLYAGKYGGSSKIQSTNSFNIWIRTKKKGPIPTAIMRPYKVKRRGVWLQTNNQNRCFTSNFSNFIWKKRPRWSSKIYFKIWSINSRRGFWRPKRSFRSCRVSRITRKIIINTFLKASSNNVSLRFRIPKRGQSQAIS